MENRSHHRTLLLRALLPLAVALGGCATAYELEEEPVEGEICAEAATDCVPVVPATDLPGSPAGGPATDDAPPPSTGSGPSTDAPPTAEPGGAGSSPAAPPAAREEPQGGIPCEIERIITENCGTCHGAQPRFGAPQSLTTLEALSTWSSYIVDRVTNVQRPMPPPPTPALSGSDLNTLVDWLRGGTPAGAGCDTPSTPPPEEDVVPEMPAPEADCDHVLDLTAHGPAGPEDANGYQVPRQNDIYTCFAFTAPWLSTVHALSFHPVVDDDRVLHHWLLYSADSASTSIHGRPRQNGEVYGCDGTNPGLALVAGWAPGGIPAVMPPEVGLEMPPPGGMFILEIHYHNDAGVDARDKSGVRLCATENLRPNTAAMHWLGEERGPAHILPFSVPPGDSEITGHCNPNIQTPVHVLTTSPHMHRRGTRMRTVIHRAGGGDETLLDTPFDYQNQIIYQSPNILNPGDRLSTTCYFRNPGGTAHFGTSTDDEMCFNFVTAWPIGQLETGGSLVGAKHACLR